MKFYQYKNKLLFFLSLMIILSLVGCSTFSNNYIHHDNNNAENIDGENADDENIDSENMDEIDDEENSAKEKENENEDKNNQENESKEDPPDTATDPIKEKMDGMTMEEKIGQMLMFGFEDTIITEETRKLIADHHIGGVILFKKNIIDHQQLLELNNQIKEINSQYHHTPIFISVDEEGGLVSRMPSEILNLPTSKEIGDSNNPKLAYQVGKAIGERVGAFGFNMTMAPVLDINSNPSNPVIGKRAFGNNKEIVSEMGINTMKGIQSQSVIPVVKHFPGHGDTDVDSHLGLPVLIHEMERLRKMEFVPFLNAFHQNADMTMIAHILLPKIDDQYPSSLSKQVITNILRDELNFDGVIITDDLTMGAITENYDIGEASIRAVEAGNDIVLVCHGQENKMKVLNSLTNAVKDGNISEERIDESVERILQLKEKYQLSDRIHQEIDLNKINQSSEEIIRALP